MRFYKHVKPDREYPLSIRRDLLKIIRRDTRIAEDWARIPVKGRRGGVWVAIKPHRPIEPEMEIRKSKLFKRDGDFHLHIVVQKEIDIPDPKLTGKTVIIACDIGEANPIVSVELWNHGAERRNVKFHGGEVRGIRTLYSRIRKVIGRKKVKHGARVLRRIDKESRKVNDILHRITRRIVERAKKLRSEGLNPIIVYGDIKNVGKPGVKWKKRCRKNNHKIHTMTSHKIKHILNYKSLWEGIPSIGVNESYTSQLCWRCGSLNTLTKKRFFKCKNCGLEYNRDLNGAVNIGNRLLGYMLRGRGSCEPPSTSPEITAPKGDYQRPQYAREEAPCESWGAVHNWIMLNGENWDFTSGLVSGGLKERFERWVGPRLSILTAIGVTPNLLTMMGLMLSAASAWLYLNWSSHGLMLLLAAVTLLISGFLDSIDGVLARTSGKSSILGGYLDSLSDRYSDAMVLGSITLSGLCGLSWGLTAVVGSMMVSYARARAEASGVDMRAVGLAERAERILILSAATVLSYLNREALSWGVAFLALLSHITVLQRVLHFYKEAGSNPNRFRE